MTTIQLETGYLELPKGIDFPIDLSFADIKTGGRSGGFSRVLELDGNQNNIQLLGGYFDIDLESNTFNRNKKTSAAVIQNGVAIFEGFIQLLAVKRINKRQGTNAKAVKYSVAIFDEVSNFFNEMGDKELTDLRFPEFSHVYNRTNIIASWSNTSGYTYPMYARNDFTYTLRDFKPAIYEIEYFKKIFKANGYSFQFAQQNDLDIQMNKRIIPYNGKAKDEAVTALVKQAYTVRGEMDDTNYLINAANTATFPVGYLPSVTALDAAGFATYASQAQTIIELDTIFQDSQIQWDGANDRIINKAGDQRTWTIQTAYTYSLQMRGISGIAFQILVDSGLSRLDIVVTLVAQSLTDPNKVLIVDAGTTVQSYTSGVNNFAAGWHTVGSGSNNSIGSFGLFGVNEEFHVHAFVMARYYNASGDIVNLPVLQNMFATSGVGDLPATIVEPVLGNFIRLEFDLQINDLSLRAVPDVDELVNGTIVDVTAFIPKKIKQRDLVSSIAKSYNLLFVPDPDNPRNIIIKTRDKYYDDGDVWDWTYKFDESQDNEITFLSNDVAQKHAYKYREDKDLINTNYQDQFKETYGQATLTLDNEYTVGTDERTLIYSPSPDIQASVGFALPSIDGVAPENNIRVLLHTQTGSVPPYPFYDDILPTPASMAMISVYNRTSMFDDVKTPNFSICFDAPKVLYHSWQSGQTSNYLYNLHHKRELATINKGKMLKAYFNLTEKDFQKLSKRLDWKVYIRDNGWFYISKIVAYNASKRTLTMVELITADDETDVKNKVPLLQINTAVISGVWSAFFNAVNMNTNIIIGQAVVMGSRNLVIGNGATVMGDNNVVLSDNTMVLGSRNRIETGAIGSKVLGDDAFLDEQGIWIGRTKV
jgi:hypothetical protein